MRAWLCLVLVISFLDVTEGGGCNAYTGSPTSPASLGTSEQTISNTGLAVRLSGYSTSCACGIITQWAFYTRRNGTVIFYALDGTTVKGKTSISIPELSHDNYYEVPLSSDMWISVRSGYTLGFLTPDLPMITYVSGSSTSYQYYSTTGQSEVAIGSTGSFGSSLLQTRQYAVRAYIETGHNPVFTNLPYTVTIFTHDVNSGSPLFTVSATDLDPDDVSALSISATSYNSPYFTFTGGSTGVLTYVSAYPGAATLPISVTVTDGCLSTTNTLTVILINEAPTLTNLPATYALPEKGSGSTNIFTITYTDPSSETVSCTLDASNDVDITANFTVSGTTVSVTYPAASGGFTHDTRPAYDLLIKCSDANNDVYSVLNVDITKNEPPVYTAGSGFLPASANVGRDASPLYTLVATDAEGDGLTFSLASCSRTNCPITVSTGGVVTSTSNLPGPNYDLTIEVTDGYNVVSKILSLLVSEDLAFGSAPTFRNLDATIYVSENTPPDTPLYALIYTDVNTWESFTYTRIQVDAEATTYFRFNDTTGVVYVLASFDFESVSASQVNIDYRILDSNSNRDRETLTVIFANVNEGPTLTIATTTIYVDEGPKDSVFSNPGLAVADPDTGDAALCKWSLDCGADSKYFYINDADQQIYLAREYDMDTGLTGNATCVVSVIDPKGLSSTGTLTLSITNINDHDPRFPYHRYLFLQSPDDAFFTRVENLSATDKDSNQYGSALGTITYAFDTTNYPQSTTYYQVDVNGVLYVNDVSSFSRGNSYVFKMFAVDSGSRTGTTTISILFAEVETVTTTTTQRNYTFGDDFANYIWLFIVAILITITLVIIAFMVWFDPVVHDFVAYKLMRIDEWCRHKPKHPKRTVGKLTVTVNNKTLENDPDNALPWELLAKDSNVPEMNQIQEEITKRKERNEKDYMKLTGRNIFEKGKGVRPATAKVDVHSSASGSASNGSVSPQYDSFVGPRGDDDDFNGQDNEAFEGGGPNQWDSRHASSPIIVVTPAPDDDTLTIDGESPIRDNDNPDNTQDYAQDDALWNDGSPTPQPELEGYGPNEETPLNF